MTNRLFTHLFKIFSLTAIILVAIACQASVPNQSLPSPTPSLPQQVVRQPSQGNGVKFTILKVGANPLQQGFQPQPQAFVFRNQPAWTKFWQNNPVPAPSVNFTREMVIAVTTGSRPTGGYSVQIDRIERSSPSPQNKGWVIHYTETTPAQNCVVIQQATTPTAFVLTQNSNALVTLQGKKTTRNCSN